MRASPSFFSSNNGLAAVSEPVAETGGIRVWGIQMNTSTALARAKALPIRVELKMHLVWEESRAANSYAVTGALDRIYTRLSKSQYHAPAAFKSEGCDSRLPPCCNAA